MQRPVVVLPQPTFADEAERLAAPDVEAHAVDRLDVPHSPRNERPLGHRKVFLQPADTHQHVARCVRAPATGASRVMVPTLMTRPS